MGAPWQGEDSHPLAEQDEHEISAVPIPLPHMVSAEGVKTPLPGAHSIFITGSPLLQVITRAPNHI